MINDLFEFVFETISPFLPYFFAFFCIRLAWIFFKHIVYDPSSEVEKPDIEQSDNEEMCTEEAEHENPFGLISIFSVLLDKEIFRWEGDYAKEVKKGRLKIYYTDNGINKSFSCDLDDHIVVKES